MYDNKGIGDSRDVMVLGCKPGSPLMEEKAGPDFTTLRKKYANVNKPYDTRDEVRNCTFNSYECDIYS